MFYGLISAKYKEPAKPTKTVLFPIGRASYRRFSKTLGISLPPELCP